MRSRPRLPVLRMPGSRATAAVLIPRGTPGRCLPARRVSRAPCRCTTPARGTGRMLALDLDTARAAAQLMMVPDSTTINVRWPAAEVAAQAGELAGLVARCGGQVLADVAPSGGRHVFVLFAAALPWRELRDLARAIALRFPAVDPAPMASLGGQISPARFAAQVRRVADAHDAAGGRQGGRGAPERAGVWDALLAEFAAELQQAERAAGKLRSTRRCRAGRRRRPVDARASAAARPSAPSLTRRPAPGGGTGHATRAAARPGWPS